MDKKQKNQNSIGFIIIFAALIALIGGAYLLYERLGNSVEMPGLVVEESKGSVQGTTGATGDKVAEGEDTGKETADSGAADGDDTQQTLAPDFTVYDENGNAYKLSDFRGKPVVLNFWASWCGPCKSEMPDFEEIYKMYGDDIHFLMVNMTDGAQETVESAGSFIAQAGYTFPVYYDTASEAAYTYGVYSIPTTFFFDAEGYGVAYGSGAMSKDVILTGIEMILPEGQQAN